MFEKATNFDFVCETSIRLGIGFVGGNGAITFPKHVLTSQQQASKQGLID